MPVVSMVELGSKKYESFTNKQPSEQLNVLMQLKINHSEQQKLSKRHKLIPMINE